MLTPPVLSPPRSSRIDAKRHAPRRPASRLRSIAVQVCAAAVLVLGAPAATAWAAAAATPAPPVAPALTSTGDPGVTQQKAVGIVAGQTLVLLDAAGHTAPASGVTVAGQGTYVLNGSAVLWFEPLPAFRGTAHSVRYRLTDEFSQSATGTYTPTVTGGGASGGSATPSVRLTTAALNVATGAPLPIGCGLSSGRIADCQVSLVATIAGHHVTIGTGAASPDTAVPAVLVHVTVNERGRQLSRQLGGVPVHAEGSVAVAGMPGRVTGAIGLRLVASSFLLPRSVHFASRSARLSRNERRYLISVARSVHGVRRMDCIGAGRDVRAGSRRTRLALARAHVVCAYLRARVPDTTVLAPRAERTGDRRGTTRHADLLVSY